MLPCASANTCTSMWRGRGQVFLDQHPVVAEGAGGLALWRESSAAANSPAAVDDAHAAAAAAGRRLDQHRIADPRGLGERALRVLGLAVIARHDRHAGALPSALWPPPSTPIARIAAGGGPMKTIPAAAQACGELGVLRQEAVAGMDRLRRRSPAPPRGSPSIVEIALARRRPARSATPRRPSSTCSAPASASE